jgi:hypothetical protein
VSLAASRGIPIHIIASITGQNAKTTIRHYAGVIDKQKFTLMRDEMGYIK